MSAQERAALFCLDGKTALIVGGYGGIGEVTSKMLSRQGATVVIAGRSAQKAQALAATISEERPAFGVRVDVADPTSVRSVVAAVGTDVGPIDILVNLAGVDVEGKAEDVSEEDWRRVIDVNLSGAFWLSQAVGQAMIARGAGGRIVHFSSTRSLTGARRGFAPYAASKAGVNLLVKQLATEWAPHRITVNAVAPGFVPTDLVREAQADDRFVSMMINRIPAGRFARPEEVAAAALFLVSTEASFVTGQILFVDGGVTSSS